MADELGQPFERTKVYYEQIIEIEGIKAYTRLSLKYSQKRRERLLDQKKHVTS